MKIVKLITALTLGGVVAAGAAMAASASPAKLTDEVTSASIRVKEGTAEDQASLLKLARITQSQATAAALATLPGQAVKAQLDDEDGFLVWQVDVKQGAKTTEVAIDAGNGKVLAAEPEEDDDRGGADRDNENQEEGGGED